jgi:hypothetical protein
MFKSVQFLFNTFDLNIGKFSMPVPYWQAATIVFLIFLLILTMANFRKHYIDWSLKGGIFGVFFGFILALILEGFLLVGGKTALIEVLGWKNPPKPLAQVLDAGKSQLIKVLGVQTQNITVQNTMETLQSLAPGDLKQIKNTLCAP